MTRVIGIDPGTNGGIVVLERSGAVATFKMPETGDGVVGILRRFPGAPIYIEKIPKFCGAARFAERKIMGSSLAVLYGNYKLCVGVGLGLGNPVRELVPLKWQNAVACRNHERAGNTDWKNKLKRRAQELFPGVHVTLWNADALLIAYAGRQLTPTE